jgi:hypothetical protein
MSKRWRVNDGTQVDVGGKMRLGGEEFSATDSELDEHGSRAFVTEVRQQSAPKGEDKAVRSPQARDTKSDK